MAEPTFFDVVRSQRGVRLYRSDPVSQEDVDRILRAAVRAPSAANRQPWVFIVIRDREVKRSIGELYRQAQSPDRPPPPPGHFTRETEEVPVIIVACVDLGDRPNGLDLPRAASIYPAVQNLLLAAAALGLGTRLTIPFQNSPELLTELLGIPEGYAVAALIPLGYPAEPDHLGGSIRPPIADVTFDDHWGNRPAAGAGAR
ncbi:MAG: nitroreductase family protein [Chloroflexi bacterium]|nr:nitroreductase family protein [Chloroflexota bacterium]MCH7654359.1 nitroreductase family protein [Chloroflexota bacterium]